MKNIDVSEQLNTYKKKVKSLNEKVHQRNKRIKNMNELINSLKKGKLILDEQCSLLEHNFSGMAETLFQNQMKNTKTTPYGHCYTDEIKQFAMTLHYYSPKA